MFAQAVACLLSATAVDHLPPQMVAAILTVEGGAVGMASHNGNGTDDFGPGQINSFWLKEVARAASRSPEQARQLLQWDGCFNIRVTSRILRYEVTRANGALWSGVAHYHSPDPEEGQRYVQRIRDTGVRLFGPGFAQLGAETARPR